MWDMILLLFSLYGTQLLDETFLKNLTDKMGFENIPMKNEIQ